MKKAVVALLAVVFCLALTGASYGNASEIDNSKTLFNYVVEIERAAARSYSPESGLTFNHNARTYRIFFAREVIETENQVILKDAVIYDSTSTNDFARTARMGYASLFETVAIDKKIFKVTIRKEESFTIDGYHEKRNK